MRRNESGAFTADWLLVITAVMGLGGLSAYLVEDYVESLTLERSAEQRDVTAYVDDGRALNADHRTVRHAAAAAEAVVEEALSVEPGDARFPNWAAWAGHFDAKCRRLALSYSHLDGFAVRSLFLPPLRPKNKPSVAEYEEEPSRARDPLTADGLTAADTTPYADSPHDKSAKAADLVLLANRKKIMLGKVTPYRGDGTRYNTVQHAQEDLFKDAVAWCYLPRSTSAVTAGGELDKENPRLLAARTYARGVAQSARQDDHKSPGDEALPGTWRNWASHWDAKCQRTLDAFRDLRGLSVRSRFEKPSAAPDADDLIYDPNGPGDKYPHKIADATAECEVAAA